MSDSYTLAALRGLGMDGDDSYTSAALRGCGCDCGGSYTNAALRGMGKLKKGSPEAKAFMARLRAMRASKSKGGKKLKGGVAFSTIAAALGLIPTAIKGAHAIYKWIKGSGMLKGGRNVYRNAMLRDAYIKSEIDGKYTGLAKSRKMPFRIGSLAGADARISRLKRVPKAVKDYLGPEELDDIISDAGKMRNKIRAIRSTLDSAKPRANSPSTTKTKARRTKRRRPSIEWTEEPISNTLASLGLPDGKI